MILSPEEIELIDKVALGEVPILRSDFIDLIEKVNDPDPLFMRMLSNPSLTDERRSDLERDIIDSFLYRDCYYEGIWEFGGGYLRHRFVAEYFNTINFTFDLDYCLKKIAPYLASEYVPKKGEPSAEFVLFSLVKESIKDSICFGSSCQASDLIKLVDKGYFDSFDAQMKGDLLKLIFEYGCQEKTRTDFDAIIYTWIKRGLLGGMSWDSQQKQMFNDWVKARPDLDRYLEAGFWETLSVHERALMIAPLLDRVESAIQAYPGIIQFLRLEKPSPLLNEVREELDQLTESFKALFYETHKNKDLQ